VIPASEQLRDTILAAVPGATVEIVAGKQPSLLVDAGNVVPVAQFLKLEPTLQLDFCSCVTGVDYLKQGYIEVVYHLYSVALKQGPVVLKVRAPRDLEQCRVPSLTPVWRSCEWQEREAFDLYGVKFEAHPDLRRILMWDGFQDYPMRKDYVPPQDYEWEPTPHAETLTRAKAQGGVVPPSSLEAKK
jgi:NADH-quinone oxidoreductase subunit C